MVPAVISKELFERANAMFRRYMGNRKKPKSVNLFHCLYCGRKLRKTQHNPKYVCDVRNMKPDLPCTGIFMEKEEAEQMVLKTVREACRMRLDNLMVQKQTDKRRKLPYACWQD